MSFSVKTHRLWSPALVLIPIACLMAITGLLARQRDSLIMSSRWVDHSDEVIGETFLIQTLVLDLETGFRGYLLTRKKEFLQPYESARAALGAEIRKFQDLTQDNPSQQRRMRAVQGTLSVWLRYSERLIGQPGRTSRPAPWRAGEWPR